MNALTVPAGSCRGCRHESLPHSETWGSQDSTLRHCISQGVATCIVQSGGETLQEIQSFAIVRAVGSARCLLSPLLRLAQPPRHLLVVCSVICPTLGGSPPAIILDRQVDAAVDEELHGFVIFVKHQLMQDAGRLVGTPVRVYIGAMPEKKVSDLKMAVNDRPGERGIE